MLFYLILIDMIHKLFRILVKLLLTVRFEEMFQKEASLCSFAVRPALVKVTYFYQKRH